MNRYSRRSFLAGVAVTGIGSAWAGNMLDGRWRDVPLRVACGEDRSGARKVLMDMWNAHSPGAQATIVPVKGSAKDQLRGLREHAEDGTADLLALDVAHLAEFRAAGWITPLAAYSSAGFVQSVSAINKLYEDRKDFWALPFNTDCGVMFHRIPAGAAGNDEELLRLDRLLDQRKPTWIAQLPPEPDASDEAFMCNVLEHAMAVVPDILGADGTPAASTDTWVRALDPLREAISAGVVLGAAVKSDEAMSTGAFNAGLSERMRNWPNQYRLTEEHRYARQGGYQVRVTGLPTGVLGGQSLAVVARGPHRDAAVELANFLSGEAAQRILASFGFAPVHAATYDDEELRRVFPYLPYLRGHVERARPRPVKPTYDKDSPDLLRGFRSFLFGRAKPPTFGSGFAEALQRLQ
jgi:multiple sugar transport system substrate-binding protein